MTHRLSDNEREALARDGYVLREGVFTRDEVREIVDACEQLVTGLVDGRQSTRYHVGSYTFDPDQLTGCTIKWEGDTDVVHGIEPFAHLSPELEKWAYDPRLIDPSIDFVGDPEPALFTEKLNLKRPHHGGPNPFHQDHPYWVGVADDPLRVVTAMLFLDDASLENGTLEVIPGSHTSGEWPRRTDADFFGRFEMDPAAAEGKPTVPIEVEAGAVVFFGALLVHKSNPNTSDRDRRALLYSYQPKGFTHMLDVVRRGT
ncbi:MAG TPA: phytanoyl-CoA dioxygenase family protein [Acidimicrobiales bacterium]|nr:phytanoyl-CoA dioxygenase family protein [Acidimicrobiales bacterium]